MTQPRSRAERSDARRNREAIAHAARAVLVADPRASMAEIAERAGVSRVTLYGHVTSRAALVGEVLAEHAAAAEAALDACDLRGPARAVVRELTECSWSTMAGVDALIVEAETELGSDAVRAAHAGVVARIEEVVARGQRSGAFATLADAQWLALAYTALLSAAASHARAGGTANGTAGGTATDTVLEDLVTSVVALLGAGENRPLDG